MLIEEQHGTILLITGWIRKFLTFSKGIDLKVLAIVCTV